MKEMYERTALLIGEDALARLLSKKVAVAGLGGVGGHCAEALARAGVGQLCVIDCDVVTQSNLNRQLVATKHTLNERKTDAMAARIRDVSDCLVTTADVRIDAGTVETAVPADADFIIDAIDSVTGKLALILYANEHGIPIVSCMGAGNRLDPMGFHVIDIYETQNCPLARVMRRELRKRGVSALPVVCSAEPSHAAPGQRVIGSLAPVTAAAGLCAAGYALSQLIKE